MADLQLCLLGTFEVCRDFVPIPHGAWRHPLAQKLLKLILLRRPDPVPIAEAARLLGGVPESEILAAVAQANRVLAPGAFLLADSCGLIRFEAGPHCWIDLDAMLSHYDTGVSAAARGVMLPAVLAFQEADALYQGALLEELQEPWAAPARKRIAELYIEILERLAEGHAVLARYQDAVGFCHKALAHDPLRESAYQRMMVYYYYLGDLLASQEAYDACRQVLEDRGRTISEETAALWQSLSAGRLAASPAQAAAAAVSASGRRLPKDR